MKLISEEQAINAARLPWMCVLLGWLTGVMFMSGLVLLSKERGETAIIVFTCAVLAVLVTARFIRKLGFKDYELQDLPQ